MIDPEHELRNTSNLYCGGNVGCQVAQTDLTAIPLDKKTSLGAGKNKFKCRSGKKRERPRDGRGTAHPLGVYATATAHHRREQRRQS